MCDALFARGERSTVFAKNSDRPADEVQLVEWLPGRPPGGDLRTQYLTIPDTGSAGVLGSRPGWLWGLEHGVNEHGVAIGNEKLWTARPALLDPPALIGMDLVRLGLERARDTDEAVDVITGLIEAHGQAGPCRADGTDPYFSSFLVADRHGGAVIETSGRDWVARDFTHATSISNRFTLGRSWTRAAAGIDQDADVDLWWADGVPTTLADHRLAATRSAVAGPLSPADAVATLRHHGTGPWGRPGDTGVEPPPAELGADLEGVTVCMHLAGSEATTAAMVAELPADGSPLRIWCALGSPCVSVFVPVLLPHVPPELSDPAQWRRFDELRRRVEADPDALAPIRALLGPLEGALWAEAAAVDDPGSGPAAELARSAWPRISDALRALGV